MNEKKPSNTAASVRQRLLNLARQRKEEFQLVLSRYAAERLLYRLSQSKYGDEFTLKGAMLFQLWTGQPHRSTLDLDLLGSGEDGVKRFEMIFREIFADAVEDDGLLFQPESLKGEEIREDRKYGGVRIHGMAMLASARIPLQIDVGIGDAITPKAAKVEYPTLLDMPAPKVKAYPKETVVAEKYEAMVLLGITNSRMKDFYDLWILSTQFEFAGAVLMKAVKATFERRGTMLPATTPVALSLAFVEDGAKQLQWTAFIRRGRLIVEAPPLDATLRLLNSFLMPITEAAIGGQPFTMAWVPGGPWK